MGRLNSTQLKIIIKKVIFQYKGRKKYLEGCVTHLKLTKILIKKNKNLLSQDLHILKKKKKKKKLGFA